MKHYFYASCMGLLLLFVGCSKLGDDDNTGSVADTSSQTESDAQIGTESGSEGGVGSDRNDGTLSSDDVDSTDTSCGSTSVAYSSAAPTAMLVIDRSGSMKEDFGGRSRWAVAREALIDPQTGFVAQLDGEIRFGIAMYAGAQNGGACPYLEGVNPTLNNFPTIAGVYTTSEPLSNTPTPAAIRAVTDILLADPTPGNKVMILVTDGLPDTCENPQSQDAAAQNAAVVAVNNAYVAGIDTYVISVGEQEEAGHFQALADAGIGAAAGDGQYFAAENQSALIDALGTIMSDIRSCKFNLRGRVVADLVDQCVVTINQTAVRYVDAENSPLDTDTATASATDTATEPLSTDSATADSESFVGVDTTTDATFDSGVVPVDTSSETASAVLSDGAWRLNSATQMELMGAACTAIQEGEVAVNVNCPCDAFVPTPVLVE